VPTGDAAYNNLSKNTTETISKFRDKICELTCRSSATACGTAFHSLRAIAKQCESGCGCPRGVLYVFDKASESVALWMSDSHGSIEDLLRDISDAV
jgi:hypothetical protein